MILSTSASKTSRRVSETAASRETAHRSRTLIVWILVSVFFLVFSVIYQQFSHGVHSPYMTYLCAWPLMLGVIPSFLWWRVPKIPKPNIYAKDFYFSGILAVTMSSLLRGVLEIAGTASEYQGILMWIGAGLMAIGIVLYVLRSLFK